MTEVHWRKFCVVEAKKFEFVLINRGVEYLRVVERGRGFTKGVVLGKATARWLDAVMDEALVANNKSYFTKSIREGDKVVVIQRMGNAKGRYLSLSELGVGRRLGLIIIPEGRQGKGWYDFNNTLGEVLFPVRKSSPAFTATPISKQEAWKTPKQWAQVFAQGALPEKKKMVEEAAVDLKMVNPRRDSRKEEDSEDQTLAKISAKNLAGVKWDDLERDKGTRKTKCDFSLVISTDGAGKRKAMWGRVPSKPKWVPREKGKGELRTGPIVSPLFHSVESGESSGGPGVVKTISVGPFVFKSANPLGKPNVAQYQGGPLVKNTEPERVIPGDPIVDESEPDPEGELKEMSSATPSDQARNCSGEVSDPERVLTGDLGVSEGDSKAMASETPSDQGRLRRGSVSDAVFDSEESRSRSPEVVLTFCSDIIEVSQYSITSPEAQVRIYLSKLGAVVLGVSRWACGLWRFSLEAQGVGSSAECLKVLIKEGTRRCKEEEQSRFEVVEADIGDECEGRCDSVGDVFHSTELVVGQKGFNRGEVQVSAFDLMVNGGEVSHDPQFAWVCQKLVVFADKLGFSFNGYECEAAKLFMSLVRRGIQPSTPVMRQYARRAKSKRGNRELRRLVSTVNYDSKAAGNLVRSSRRRGGKLVRCL